MSVISAVGADAKVLLSFFAKAKKDIAIGQKAEPVVVAALGTLLGAVTKTIADGAPLATTPGACVNISLDVAVFADLKEVWGDVEAFATALGIKL